VGNETFVIAGASLAGATAAQTLREEGFSGQIILIGKEAHLPYERPPLSKGFLLGKQELSEAFVHEQEWYEEKNIDLRLSTEVTSFDPAAQTVMLSTGEQLSYTKLLLATGAQPRQAGLGAGVSYLRTMDDSKALKAALKPGSDLVIIGAGWIGLEVAAAAREHGASVTVVESDSLPLRKVLGDEVAKVFRDLHTAHGVVFHFGATVASAAAPTGGKPGSVTLGDGAVLPADLIVAGVGIVPDTGLAERAGLATSDGITVSAALRTSAPAVFACGDAANWDNPILGTHMRVEHWENARQSAMTAARAMLGQAVSYNWIPYFFSDQYDAGMEYSGWVGKDGYDRVIFRGDPASGEYLAFWVKDSRVLAGMNVNIWDVQDVIRALIEAPTVDLARLADPDVPLMDL
jgi:3-phenylpropionate/trans-cinnamate dioxygenase ferredoxin reductase subunit